MTHPKTIEAYKAAGIDDRDWKNWHEKGTEIVVRERKAQLKNDKNQVVKVNNVYRKRVDNPDTSKSEPLEVITWDQTTTGHTGLGNPVEYYENASDLCFWIEPTTTTKTIFNPVTEEKETVVVQEDFSNITKHYLYEFNKENIAMIKKITANNISKCNWGVMDESTGRARTVNNFEDWSTKTFDELLYPPRLFTRRPGDTDPNQTAGLNQYK